ncbi:hypothetical protein ACH5RR_005276 [Cinchona calisaya]|uniref:Uncharacterized protein n=1 Tax=Cinchona calisaya TaxID=153742 RepID=A0ABD3AKP6_9GENT
MAKDSDDLEHWLLPQFLTDDDDDLFAQFNNSNYKNDGRNTARRDFQHPFCPQSDLSSPSTETESDDDEYITGLTQKMAHSTLYDSAALASENKTGWGLSGSPQSTLQSALCGGCGCNHGSSRGSPNCPLQVASPTTVMNGKDAAWDLLYAAAGEVARLRMIEGAAGFHPRKNGPIVPPIKPSPISLPQRTSGLQTHLSNQQHLKAAQFQQLRQQQMMKQQATSGAWGQGKFQLSLTQDMMILNRGRIGTALGKSNVSMSAWPTFEQSQRPQQQQPKQPPGLGTRAVFLGNPGTKRRECAGTGVFLPRRFGTPAETHKKSAYSTVLLPDRVVQALNLNLKLEAVDATAQPRCNGGLGPDYDAAAGRYRNSVGMMVQQRRQQKAVVMNEVQEIHLPQEWTY